MSTRPDPFARTLNRPASAAQRNREAARAPFEVWREGPYGPSVDATYVGGRRVS